MLDDNNNNRTNDGETDNRNNDPSHKCTAYRRALAIALCDMKTKQRERPQTALELGLRSDDAINNARRELATLSLALGCQA